MSSWEMLGGDCLETLATLEDNSIDAVVTDPPYGLSAEPDAAEVLRHWLAGDDYEHRGGGFMGKSWDSFVPGPKVWAEAFRVLKPGGHMVAFFGTRTYDLGAMAIRLAGFEIRDCMAWHYGSGFPKSLNVSKAIDKAAGAEREVVGKAESWNRPDSAAGDTARMNASPGEYDVTAPATEEAKRWEGWGTALKPATEPIVLARKPLEGTVADNVTRHGTGALNIDGCRIEVDPDDPVNTAVWTSRPSAFMEGQGFLGGANEDGERVEAKPDGGRWPANLILDEKAAEMIDEQADPAPAAPRRAALKGGNNGALGAFAGSSADSVGVWPADPGGGPSRFFYCPKANTAERNAGLDNLPKSPKQQLAGTFADGRFMSEPVANQHPTVKPIDLMRYLCRLITPPGGKVLDPFSGSGTTGIASGLEGFDFVGIERDDDYRQIAEIRLAWWGDKSGETIEILQKARLVEQRQERDQEMGQATLFGE